MLALLWHGTRDAFLMFWQVWWALVLGFVISAIVQTWVSRERIEASLSGNGPRPVGIATALGAASSSCSYAAVAITKSLFQKGASTGAALAFQVASTNLVWELGILLWLLIGWQFTVGEYLGGLTMIVLIATSVQLFVSPLLERQAREQAQGANPDHNHQPNNSQLPWGKRMFSFDSWSSVAHNFCGDWRMLWKEIVIGFVLAGFIAQLGNDFFSALFISNAPRPLTAIENAIIGPLIAVLSFVCSVGNVPVAAVLWSGGFSFAGVLSFLFADLIVLPIISIYRRYYGNMFALRITALMFVAMVLAALFVDCLFSALGAIPATRPNRNEIFGSTSLVDYKLILNIAAAIVCIALIVFTRRQGSDRIEQ